MNPDNLQKQIMGFTLSHSCTHAYTRPHAPTHAHTQTQTLRLTLSVGQVLFFAEFCQKSPPSFSASFRKTTDFFGPSFCPSSRHRYASKKASLSLSLPSKQSIEGSRSTARNFQVSRRDRRRRTFKLSSLPNFLPKLLCLRKSDTSYEN